MHASFLGKDPDSTEGASPTLFATDRTDRVTYIAQGWRVKGDRSPGAGRRRPGARPRDPDRDPRRGTEVLRPSLPAAEGGRKLTLIEPGPEFAKLFETFEHTAYRLETRDQYNIPREAEPLRKFLAGEPDISYHENWSNMVRQATTEGRRFSRVRVVSFPLTDYTRFAMWVGGHTREAGDDIRYITRDQAVGLPDYDYWLFDSRKLLKMRFTNDDQFIGGEVIEDLAEIVQHNYWRDAAQHHAVTRDEFCRQV